MSRRSRLLLLALAPIALLLLGAAAFVGRGLYSANLHEVVPGRLWRSAQVSPDEIANIVRAKGIRLVVNLRNERDPGQVQREREEAACRAAGADFVTIPFSSKHLPPPERMRALLEVLHGGATPMLVHCRSGSDRTGLASAIYLVVERGVPLEEAIEMQLSWRTGHLPIGDGVGVDRFIDLYRATSGGRDLRTWILEDYPRLYGRISE